MAHGGAGVGRCEDQEADGRTWFVEGALPGELVTAEVLKAKKRFVRARVLEILTASEHRVEAPCALAERCGGCSWQHVDSEVQARLKGEVVANQLRRLPLELEGVEASPKALGYRRRARVHYQREGDEFLLGFHGRRSRDVIDNSTCPVLEPALDQAFQRVRALAAYLPRTGTIHGISDGQKVILGLPGVKPDDEIVALAQGLLEESRGLVGLVFRGGRKRHGVGQRELEIDGGQGELPVLAGPFGFTQAQSEQNRALVDYVGKVAQAGGKQVLELYAGAGNFTRRLARDAKRVKAIDDTRESISSLRRLANAHRLGIDAKHGNVDKLLPALDETAKRYDVVVLDPPRGGVGREGAAQIARTALERIVYISCDPATLARDLEAMLEARPGLRVEHLRVFDMMPMTSEVESVVTLVAGPAPAMRST
jgi:23S rRNA (uracil1939-C5)-methyltransferase